MSTSQQPLGGNAAAARREAAASTAASSHSTRLRHRRGLESQASGASFEREHGQRLNGHHPATNGHASRLDAATDSTMYPSSNRATNGIQAAPVLPHFQPPNQQDGAAMNHIEVHQDHLANAPVSHLHNMNPVLPEQRDLELQQIFVENSEELLRLCAPLKDRPDLYHLRMQLEISRIYVDSVFKRNIRQTAQQQQQMFSNGTEEASLALENAKIMEQQNKNTDLKSITELLKGKDKHAKRRDHPRVDELVVKQEESELPTETPISGTVESTFPLPEEPQSSSLHRMAFAQLFEDSTYQMAQIFEQYNATQNARSAGSSPDVETLAPSDIKTNSQFLADSLMNDVHQPPQSQQQNVPYVNESANFEPPVNDAVMNNVKIKEEPANSPPPLTNSTILQENAHFDHSQQHSSTVSAVETVAQTLVSAVVAVPPENSLFGVTPNATQVGICSELSTATDVQSAGETTGTDSWEVVQQSNETSLKVKLKRTLSSASGNNLRQNSDTERHGDHGASRECHSQSSADIITEHCSADSERKAPTAILTQEAALFQQNTSASSAQVNSAGDEIPFGQVEQTIHQDGNSSQLSLVEPSLDSAIENNNTAPVHFNVTSSDAPTASFQQVETINAEISDNPTSHEPSYIETNFSGALPHQATTELLNSSSTMAVAGNQSSSAETHANVAQPSEQSELHSLQQDSTPTRDSQSDATAATHNEALFSENAQLNDSAPAGDERLASSIPAADQLNLSEPIASTSSQVTSAMLGANSTNSNTGEPARQTRQSIKKASDTATASEIKNEKGQIESKVPSKLCPAIGCTETIKDFPNHIRHKHNKKNTRWICHDCGATFGPGKRYSTYFDPHKKVCPGKLISQDAAAVHLEVNSTTGALATPKSKAATETGAPVAESAALSTDMSNLSSENRRRSGRLLAIQSTEQLPQQSSSKKEPTASGSSAATSSQSLQSVNLNQPPASSASTTRVTRSSNIKIETTEQTMPLEKNEVSKKRPANEIAPISDNSNANAGELNRSRQSSSEQPQKLEGDQAGSIQNSTFFQSNDTHKTSAPASNLSLNQDGTNFRLTRTTRSSSASGSSSNATKPAIKQKDNTKAASTEGKHKFWCPVLSCDKRYASYLQMTGHLSHHPEPLLICRYCMQTFTVLKKMRRHALTVHELRLGHEHALTTGCVASTSGQATQPSSTPVDSAPTTAPTAPASNSNLPTKTETETETRMETDEPSGNASEEAATLPAQLLSPVQAASPSTSTAVLSTNSSTLPINHGDHSASLKRKLSDARSASLSEPGDAEISCAAEGCNVQHVNLAEDMSYLHDSKSTRWRCRDCPVFFDSLSDLFEHTSIEHSKMPTGAPLPEDYYPIVKRPRFEEAQTAVLGKAEKPATVSEPLPETEQATASTSSSGTMTAANVSKFSKLHICPAEGCGKVIKNKFLIAQHHKDNHTNQTKWICRDCPEESKYFDVYQVLSEHTKSVHGRYATGPAWKGNPKANKNSNNSGKKQTLQQAQSSTTAVAEQSLAEPSRPKRRHTDSGENSSSTPKQVSSDDSKPRMSITRSSSRSMSSSSSTTSLRRSTRAVKEKPKK